MAIGKSKRTSKGRKGQKKKIVDPFTKKEWYDVRAPALFKNRDVGKTPVTRTTGTKVASDALKGRVFETCLADLNGDDDRAFRKMKLIVEDVQGKNVLTNFYGMDITRDKLCSLIRKWQTMIEAWVDVKTLDGYTLRMFCIGFTSRQDKQVRRSCYAQSSQIRSIRKKMVTLMSEAASSRDLNQLVECFVLGTIGDEIAKSCSSVYPLRDVLVRKVKVLKQPKFDLVKLMEIHSGSADGGSKVTKVDEGAVATLAGSGGRL